LDAPISRDELAAFLALRRELFEIDTRFSQLGPKGIFAALDRSGLLEHQVVERAAIENAVRHAPAGSRARQRARLIRSLARDAEGITCSWTGVVDARRGRVLEMPDPYGQVWPRWRRLQQLGHTGRPDSLPPE
jgi:hypothetical protein